MSLRSWLRNLVMDDPDPNALSRLDRLDGLHAPDERPED